MAAARDLQDLWFSHYFQLTKGVWDGEAGEYPALDLMVELESELVGLGRMEPVVTGTGSMLDVPHGRELWGWRMWGPTAAVDAPSVTHWLTKEEHRVLEPQKHCTGGAGGETSPRPAGNTLGSDNKHGEHKTVLPFPYWR